MKFWLMEINFIIQILFQFITREPGQQISSWIFARFNDVICDLWEWSELSPRSTGLQNNPAEKLNEFPTWQKNLGWISIIFGKLKVRILTKIWLLHWFLTRDTGTWQINKGKTIFSSFEQTNNKFIPRTSSNVEKCHT